MATTNNNSSGLLEAALEILRRAVSGYPFTNQAQLARASGESEANISRWLSGASTPTLRRLEPVLMTLGVRFTLPGELQAQSSKCRQHTGPSDPRPLDWTVLDRAKHLPEQFFLQMPKEDTSMQPTITAGDLVMVDTTRKLPVNESVYLIKKDFGETRGLMFRRIFLNNKTQTPSGYLCADNMAAGYPPEIFSLSMTSRIIGTVSKVIKSL